MLFSGIPMHTLPGYASDYYCQFVILLLCSMATWTRYTIYNKLEQDRGTTITEEIVPCRIKVEVHYCKWNHRFSH